LSRVVLDASAAIRLVLRDPESAPLVDALQTATLVLVPAIFFTEVANGLWKYTLGDTLTTEQCVERLSEVDALVDEVFDDRELIVEAVHLAIAHDHPVYDLLYAVLARRTGAAVLTRDGRLGKLLDTLGVAHR